MKTESVTAAFEKAGAIFTPPHSAKVKHVQLLSLRSVAGPQLLSCVIVLYVCVCVYVPPLHKFFSHLRLEVWFERIM